MSGVRSGEGRRFKRSTVLATLERLVDAIEGVNAESCLLYSVGAAYAYGDWLVGDDDMVGRADVAVLLVYRGMWLGPVGEEVANALRASSAGSHCSTRERGVYGRTEVIRLLGRAGSAVKVRDLEEVRAATGPGTVGAPAGAPYRLLFDGLDSDAIAGAGRPL